MAQTVNVNFKLDADVKRNMEQACADTEDPSGAYRQRLMLHRSSMGRATLATVVNVLSKTTLSF